ncbi:TonB-dependent siderophore receptor [Aliarcobacter lanthieri]|uniref:TonB-dependent siderophore receptor n=1 Tax=Aliarcobacter lanthieri TaxID=1355374 RepID=UPI00047C9FE3|nr:TonB-dependent receptor [Aliarcobacter lanthieri]QKF58243.1 TonB-dependent siderophore receptor [Aliarcobacter lanthieri]
MKYSNCKKIVLSFALSLSLYGNESFNLEKQNLEEAIKQIASKSNMPYLVDGKLLKGKTSPKLENIEGTKNALDKVLEGTGLEATIDNNTIIIKEVPTVKVINKTYILDDVSVTSGKSGSAESGYLTDNITGVGLWGKRSLQDTPYSMTVIPQELIENVQANDMAQIFKMNPLTQDGGYQLAGNQENVIRGFSSNNPIINGMPLAYYHSFTTMEDLERIETISGATGFLYGGGRVGGAVNYVMKKPTLEDTRSIKIGNYGGEQYYGHIDLSGQIDDKNIFGYRINALYQDGDSVADVGKEQKYVSLAFDYKPTDNFTMDLNYAHRKLIQENMKSIFYVNTYRPNLDVSKSYSSDWTSTDEENDRVMTNLKWDINDIFTLRSSFLYEKSDRKLIATQSIYTRPDGLYNAYNFKYPTQGQESKNYSANIYLDSKFETFDVNHLLTIGYSENYQKYLMGSYAINIYLEGKTLDEIKNSSLPSAIAPNGLKVPDNKAQYKNILIGDDIVFNEQWSALVGVNYATVIQTSYRSGVQSSKYDKSELTPTLSLMYKPFDDLTTYVTYIESLEQGTIVGDNYSNRGEILDPLVSKQYEVGAKYSLNDSVLLTGALFRIEKANQYSDNATPMPKYVQDGEQIHQGIELTFTGKVTDNLTLFGGGTLMDIEVEKSNDKLQEGKKPINAASKMAKLYAEYNIPMIQGLTVTGGAYYTGEKYGDIYNKDKIPSYTLYDAGLRYKTKFDKFPTTFLLNVSNLTGKDYWASSRYLGDPRSVAFSMKMEF